MARRSKKDDEGSRAPSRAPSPAPSPAPSEGPASDDLALVWGASADGETLGVLRKRGDEVTPALMQRAREGQPIHGEMVRLKPREEPLLFDVDVLYAPAPSAEATAGEAPDRDGPARVATDAYRKGWDRLFKKPRGSAMN